VPADNFNTRCPTRRLPHTATARSVLGTHIFTPSPNFPTFPLFKCFTSARLLRMTVAHPQPQQPVPQPYFASCPSLVPVAVDTVTHQVIAARSTPCSPSPYASELFPAHNSPPPPLHRHAQSPMLACWGHTSPPSQSLSTSPCLMLTSSVGATSTSAASVSPLISCHRLFLQRSYSGSDIEYAMSCSCLNGGRSRRHNHCKEFLSRISASWPVMRVWRSVTLPLALQRLVVRARVLLR
jgi:hypothetical protein